MQRGMMERGAMMRPFGMAHFCGPNDTVDSGSFGQVTSLRTSPREIQMALKFYW